MQKQESSTKNQLLQTALRLMNKSGYGGLSLAALALESGMTKQRVHYHFSDLDEIVFDLAMQWSQTGQRFTVEFLSKTPYEKEKKILAIAEAMFAWIQADPELARFALVLYQAAPQLPKIQSFMEQARVTGRGRIKQLLLLSPKWKKASAAKVESAITNIHAHLYGYSFYVCITNELDDLGQLMESCLKGLLSLISQNG